MNKVGFNVLVWSAIINDEMMPIMDRLRNIGYDGVECYIGGDDQSPYKRFGQHAVDLGLETTAVCTMGDGENPISQSLDIRMKALDRLKWIIDTASEMNSKIICGPFHSAHGIFANHAPLDQEYGWSAEVLHKAGEYAAQAEIVLGLEAVNRFECYLCNTMTQLKRLVTEAAHPNVRAMYDTHHASLEEKSITDPIQTIAPVLAHVHISENDRGTPGDGLVHWDKVFSSLADINYKGWFTIEAFSRNDPDFANAINVWREYSKPWEIAENGFKFIKEMSAKYAQSR
jgi:D-psicose/D-tagatose/L-ribulose 3-epimerase